MPNHSPATASRRRLLAAAAFGASSLAAAPPPVPRAGGTLDALLNPEPPALLPGLANDMPSLVVLSQIFQGLVRPGRHELPEGELALGWEIGAGGRALLLHLRPGVFWHDGAPFTAADVAFSLLTVHRRHSPRLAQLLSLVTAVESPDPHTLGLAFAAPLAPFLLQSGVAMPILPCHRYAGGFTATLARQPVGCGPFALAEWRQGESIRLVRNPRYWKPGRPYVDAVVWHFLAGSDRRAQAVETGAVALACADGLDPADVARFAALPALAVEDGGAGWLAPLVTLECNYRLAALADLRVRLAIAHAIDREALVGDLWGGTARLAQGPLASSTPLFDCSLLLPRFDPDRARHLLDSAGLLPDGRSVRLRLRHLVLPYGEVWEQLSLALADQLARIGIILVPERLTPAAWTARLAAWDYDTTVTYTCQWGEPEVGVERSYSAANIRHVAFANTAGFSDAWVEGAFALARAGGEKGVRAAAWRGVQRRLVALAAQVWLFELPLPVVRRRALLGLSPEGGGVFSGLEDVYFAAL